MVSIFGFKTPEKSYLLKIDGRLAERPQHMYMRVAVSIHKTDIDSAIRTYHLMVNAGLRVRRNLIKCRDAQTTNVFLLLLTMKDDSIDGIYDTLKQTAKISQSAGGIGLAIHNIRATGSHIRGTNGTSNGIIHIFGFSMIRAVDQGGGKRRCICHLPGAWHADVFDFLELKKSWRKN